MEPTAFTDSEPGPPGPAPSRRPPRLRPSEPMFNAPWPAVALACVIVFGYAVQSLFPQDVVVAALGFAPSGLTNGQWPTLVTAMFRHGGWAPALMNGAFGLAFATPVARFFGDRLGGLMGLLAFYIACGVLSNLGYALVHAGDPHFLVGASGAVSGLMGAAARLIAGEGRLGRVFSPPVLSMGGSWLMVNLLIALLGGGFMPGGDAPVAWEAHLAGFAAGVLVITPIAWMTGRR